MKKSLKVLAVLIAVVGIFISNVNATTHTGYVLDPGWIPGVNREGPTYKLTSGYATVQGSNTGVYFSELGYLESYYVAGDRDFPLWLYEEDFTNKDDLVKTYEVYFNYDYRSIYNIQVRQTNLPGNIEDSGDNVGEFYLSGKMQRLSGDPSSATNLFKYNIFLN